MHHAPNFSSPTVVPMWQKQRESWSWQRKSNRKEQWRVQSCTCTSLHLLQLHLLQHGRLGDLLYPCFSMLPTACWNPSFHCSLESSDLLLKITKHEEKYPRDEAGPQSRLKSTLSTVGNYCGKKCQSDPTTVFRLQFISLVRPAAKDYSRRNTHGRSLSVVPLCRIRLSRNCVSEGFFLILN